MTLRKLWNSVILSSVLTLCFASVGAYADEPKQDQDKAGSGATCATPAGSRSSEKSKSKPYRRPAFHHPSPGKTDSKPPELKPPADAIDSDKYESAIEPPIVSKSEVTELPEVNQIQGDSMPLDWQPSSVPELNSPATIDEPLYLEPNNRSEIKTESILKPRPLATSGSGSGVPNPDTSEVCPPVDYNFCDSGCATETTRFPKLRRGLLGALRPFNREQRASVGRHSNGFISDSVTLPPAGIGLYLSETGTGEEKGPSLQVEKSRNVPGLMSGTSTPFSKASGPNSFEITKLPNSRTPAQRVPTQGTDEANSNGIIIHPPIVQHFNENQHTFLIENRGEADAEDVVIEISVNESDRIIAALPANSVTSDKVSMFKFPRIAGGESIPIHVTAVSNDRSPVQFSASLISRAVYSFHMHDGRQHAKLSNVSYVNDQALPKANSPAGKKADNGPVRVTNPFFGSQLGPRSASSNQNSKRNQ